MKPILQKLVTKVKPNINSVEVHLQLSNIGRPVDGALVRAGSVWPPIETSILTIIESVDHLARYLRGKGMAQGMARIAKNYSSLC